jgi:hypothetical protein
MVILDKDFMNKIFRLNSGGPKFAGSLEIKREAQLPPAITDRTLHQ